MNKWKSLLSILCAATLVAGLAACGGGAKQETQQSAGSGAQDGDGKTKPGKVRLFVPDLGKAVPTGDIKSDPTVKYMMEKSNTDLDITFLPNANYVEQLKLKFAAGDIPDAFMGFGLTQGDGALDNGLVQPLNELIDKYGPNLKKNISQLAWDSVTVNGKIMAIPEPNIAPSARVLYIRKDWLDKLGLKVPTTSDELLEVMRAFRDRDPNGNGKKDEIPFSMREKFSWVGDNIWGMWGLTPYETLEYNGEIVPGFVHPRFKEPLRFFQTMYKEKLIDPEFLTNASQIWSQKIMAGLVGIWGSMPQSAWQWQRDLIASLPNEKPEVIPIPTPRGKGWDGKVGAAIFPSNKSYLVTTKAQDPAAVVKFFDRLLSEEGQIFSELGIEGLNYTKEGDTIKYRPESEKEIKSEWRDLFRMHAKNEIAFKARYSEEERKKLEEAYAISNSEGFENLTAAMPAVGQNLFRLYYEYHEPAAKIIVEGAPVDETWDNFIATWRKQGGNELIKELTDWYNKNRKL